MYGLGWKWGLRRKSPRLIEDVSVGLKLPHDALHDLLLESPVQNQLFWNIVVNRNVQKRLLYKWVLNFKAHAQLWMAPTKNAFNTINPFRKIKGLNHLTRLLYFTMHCPEKHLVSGRKPLTTGPGYRAEKNRDLMSLAFPTKPILVSFWFLAPGWFSNLHYFQITG